MKDLFLQKEEFEDIFTNQLTIESYPKSIDSLFSERFSKKINYKPYYQRNYVWDKHKATYFLESILLGTEIPPLVFFNNGKNIEVIDGRQRFETIKRFREDELPLTKKGLQALKQLFKSTYGSLATNEPQIRDLFDDAKIRIIEFRLSNSQNLDQSQIDKVKKEIFSRYNTGITPLKKVEIENAKYDKDMLSNYLKEKLKNEKTRSLFYNVLLKKHGDKKDNVSVEVVLTFLRRFHGLTLYPIKYYARGGSRIELTEKAYEFISNNTEDLEKFYNDIIKRVNLLARLKSFFLNKKFEYNWLVFECLYWGLLVLEEEGFNIERIEEQVIQTRIGSYISSNIRDFNDKEYHYYHETMARYGSIAQLLGKIFNKDLSIYVWGDTDSKNKIKELKKYKDTVTKLGELETLRVTKPEPSRSSIDDIIRTMGKKRFLIRPSYQRKEVINYTKASAIIESIILGVPLPAIFVYKKTSGLSEVIDGQQRILTILSFIGAEYMDENGRNVRTKKHQFSLKGLRILKELNGKSFEELEENLKDRIWDFELFLVEIEEKLNEHFNPVDLFIRLNDKPYPIRENSFEMWNSWAHPEIVKKIKDVVIKNRKWMYIKKIDNKNDRDRMQNEELLTCLAYLDYEQKVPNKNGFSLDFYQKGDRVNARILDKKRITQALTDISKNDDAKELFSKSIDHVEEFIKKIILLFGGDLLQDEELIQLMNESLNDLFRYRSKRYVRRTLQDFYVLWEVLHDMNEKTVIKNRNLLKKNLTELYNYMKEIPQVDIEKNHGYAKFQHLLSHIKSL